jgi:alpha-L-fucosidase
MDRAAVLDFIYYPLGSQDTVLRSALEYPTYTYKFMFSSPFAGPTSHNETEKCPTAPYESNWRSLAFRPTPSWFDDVKFGIFIHWGVFSVPAFHSEWYWHRLRTGDPATVEFHNKNYGCCGVMPDKFPCTGPPFK